MQGTHRQRQRAPEFSLLRGQGAQDKDVCARVLRRIPKVLTLTEVLGEPNELWHARHLTDCVDIGVC